jgi:hypothetical protein
MILLRWRRVGYGPRLLLLILLLIDKASAQLPLLTQCAHLTLEDYLERAASADYRIPADTRTAIRANLALCEQELAGHAPPDTTVQEFMPVRRKDMEALRRRLEAASR